MRRRLADEPRDDNVPSRKRLAWQPSTDDVMRVVQGHFQVDAATLYAVRRHGNDARAATIYLLRRLTSERVTAIAEQFGGVSAAAISKLVKRAESRREQDRKWHRLLTKLEKECMVRQDS